MKNFFRRIILSLLASFAKSRLRISHSQVIGITGSVGKTTTKDALAFVLSRKYPTLANKKSFNSEFGLPLTILEENTATHFSDWLGIVWRSFRKRNLPLQAQYLILEMGVDTPGDMDYLLSIVHPQIGIFIRVAPVHLAEGQFHSLHDIAQEKGKLITHLPADGLAILNQADDLVSPFANETNAKITTFGAGGDYSPQDISVDKSGLAFQIQGQSFQVPIVGKHHAELFSAVSAVAVDLGFTLSEVAQALQDFHLEPGRLNLLQGIRGVTILDGSYNSNPTSARSAIDTLSEFSGRRIAVLGQMNELGAESEKYHRELGKHLQGKADFLIAVHGDARFIAEGFDNTGQNVQICETNTQAGQFLQDFVQAGDSVLFKGSQNNVRLEKAVEAILSDPARANQLLCRQGKEWQTK